MKDTEIHIGLLDEAVRILIATGIRDCYQNDLENKKNQGTPFDNKNIFDWIINDAENEIQYQKRRIELASLTRAFHEIRKKYGWIEHDVSDYVTRDNKNLLALNFIGTEEEYKELMKKIVDEKLET